MRCEKRLLTFGRSTLTVVPVKNSEPVEFETDGSAIDGYALDRRLLLSNIDKRLVDSHATLNQKIDQVQSTVQGSTWGFTIAKSDGYIASLDVGRNEGFSYIPSEVGWWDQSATSAHGFLGGQSIITTRRFEFSDPDTIATSIFRAPGLTHINVFAEVIYTGSSGGPFGVSGTATVGLGVGVETGSNDIDEEYEEELTEPLITAGCFDYGKGKHVSNNWKNWYWHARWYGYMENRIDDGRIYAPKENWQEDWGAEYPFQSYKCFGIPLISITNASDIESKIIKPLIELIPK